MIIRGPYKKWPKLSFIVSQNKVNCFICMAWSAQGILKSSLHFVFSFNTPAMHLHWGQKSLGLDTTLYRNYK